jgi:hypothetical protein
MKLQLASITETDCPDGSLAFSFHPSNTLANGSKQPGDE